MAISRLLELLSCDLLVEERVEPSAATIMKVFAVALPGTLSGVVGARMAPNFVQRFDVSG